MIDGVQHTNIAEEEMAQLHSIDLALNAIAAIRRNMLQGSGQETCTDCNEKIAIARRLAVPACIRCLHCQSLHELR